jgi:hypothetical protein
LGKRYRFTHINLILKVALFAWGRYFKGPLLNICLRESWSTHVMYCTEIVPAIFLTGTATVGDFIIIEGYFFDTITI